VTCVVTMDRGHGVYCGKDHTVKYTPNEWKRLKTTLETSGEDSKLHSKRVEKIETYTRFECGSCRFRNLPRMCFLLIPPPQLRRKIEGNDQTEKCKIHSFRVYFRIFFTLFECSFTSSPPVLSVF
jgi:hypothetical protein